ncbi:MAG: aminotransferase class III-fold pyridoxal phosphate-dependent enzyme [Alphaproteobacteria bacterium]|nr:aminotransferase class III-fold pyridoxal phosphate-dependent enzyme [Alphaproteobacteria bacterium]
MSTPLEQLAQLRSHGGHRTTQGLPDAVVARFLPDHPKLARAIDEAWHRHRELQADWGGALAMDELDLAAWLQERFVNFYPSDAVNPYVPLAARGPWIVTSHGAVLHDSGGYGMLGLGHGPDEIMAVMSKPWVIANIMTPSFSHRRFTDALVAELGHTRGGCPFDRFLCVNSGSESVTVAARIADIQANRLTAPGARHEGKEVKFLALEGGFHGRTDRPAQASPSSNATYRKHLYSFRDSDNLVTVPPNDVAALQRAFAQADADGVFFDMMLMEPVMGEGRPGLGATRAFYDEARRLTREMGTLLLVDSIQAGLRTHGVLSIVDYPGFADADPPDLETWSKAINAAQYPLSVLGMTATAADLYVKGVYGNTMTGNPRALEVGAAVLAQLTPALRQNIVDRGAELKAAFEALRDELPEVITGVSGTGLLLAIDLDPATYPVMGDHGVEAYARTLGLGVIHGGKNALRFTPTFRITSEEVALLTDLVRRVLVGYGSTAAAAK